MKVRMFTVAIVLFSLTAFEIGSSGDRAGFVIGGGFSVSPMSKTSVKSGQIGMVGADTQAGIGLNICLGYGVDGQNLLLLAGKFLILDETPEGLGFMGPAYFRYLGSAGKTPYLIVSVGLQYSVWPSQIFLDYSPDVRFGPGLRFGIGYEFARHFQCDLTMEVGRTRYEEVDYNHRSISLNFTVLSY